MHILRRLAAALALAALLTAAVPALPAAARTPAPSARSALLLDGTTGRVLYEKDADRKSLIASTTKIMTGLLACESGRLGRTVAVPAEAVGVEGSSLYLKAGQLVTVEQLLYGMMLHSGNDAAAALAIVLAGSQAAFVAAMNDRAGELGLAGTRFANPHGLDDEENYSTARDLGRLAAAAMENEDFRRVVSAKSYDFAGRSLRNHNKLLWQVEGAVGVKTGYTKAAGRILVSAAERQGRRLIAVTIHDPDDWADHQALLEYGFGQMTEARPVAEGQLLGAVPVTGGTAVLAQCRAAAGFACGRLPGEALTVRLALPRFTFAPLKAGSRAGWAEILADGALLGRVPLVWAGDVPVRPEEPGLFRRLLGG